MIRWIFPNIHVSRSLTMPATILLDIPPQEQEQMLAAPCALWLPLGLAHTTAVCPWAPSDGNRRGLVLLALQRLSGRPPLSHWRTGLHRRRRRPTRRPRADDGLAARGAALIGCAAQGPTPGVWLVPYALELRDVSGPAHGQTWAGSLRVDRPAVAP
jgi:hypothetical protein